MEPLGDPLRLLGAQWIVPKVTEYTPRIEPQTPHTDVDVKGEVVSIAIHVKGESMGTLIDAKASIHEENDVINGHGFGRAHTSAFAYDTGAVHAGPGRSHVPPPYPQYFTDRVFFLLCSDTLTLPHRTTPPRQWARRQGGRSDPPGLSRGYTPQGYRVGWHMQSAPLSNMNPTGAAWDAPSVSAVMVARVCVVQVLVGFVDQYLIGAAL